MSLCTKITRNKSLLKFRIPIPQITNKTSLHPYQTKLMLVAVKYIKKHHPTSRCLKNSQIRFQEIYDVVPYLQLTLSIFNHKNEETIIEVEP